MTRRFYALPRFINELLRNLLRSSSRWEQLITYLDDRFCQMSKYESKIEPDEALSVIMYIHLKVWIYDKMSSINRNELFHCAINTKKYIIHD